MSVLNCLCQCGGITDKTTETNWFIFTDFAFAALIIMISLSARRISDQLGPAVGLSVWYVRQQYRGHN